MEKTIIKQTILEQRGLFEREEDIVKRTVPEYLLQSQKIIVITGIRRCGKSTLLKEISGDFKNHAYANFEDERFLEFTAKDFNTLLEIFLELDPKTNTLYFDEIQNISGWEKFVRRLFTEGYKIFVTGSSSNLLSSEIATSITGRNLKYELFPFSFKEYLLYRKFETKDTYTTKEKASLSGYFEDYVKYGGFPEIIKSRNEKELMEIYQDILIKDLLVRLQIRDSKDFRDLSMYLLSNISRKMSYNNLKNLLGFSNTSKVKNYIEFLEEAYLFFTLKKYAPSLKKQIMSPRKVYSIDTGLVNAVSFMFSENTGPLLENIVFLELKRRFQEIYYHEDKKECDFLVKEKEKIIKAIQVTASIADLKTEKREIEGLKEAMEKHNLKEGYIITKDTEKTINLEGRVIHIKPIITWLME
ncbi:AAA family ATPase [Methanosarcina sp. DH2]|uniref:ATP-binding protein n=1 Tax=Methanosarcina sp. DH2 TaxID=2605639 RepID=UPI001E313F3B|nr:ATP-binding protein [Methanosarcina sp. DH2]MCC4771619.1 AAA family ATPase [Methanosarcina sp. DH2]